MEMDAGERAIKARKGSPFLNTAQAAFYVGVQQKTLKKMRGRGDGPKFRKHGRLVRYHIDDLDAWSNANASIPIDESDDHPETPDDSPEAASHGIRKEPERQDS